MNSLGLLRTGTIRLFCGALRRTSIASSEFTISKREKGYYKSRLEGPPELYTNFEKSYEEWKHIEILLAPAFVPAVPKDPHAEYASGWKPPNLEECSTLPYFVRRTKNGMLPVYFESRDRGVIQSTRIRKIEGNIWRLEEHIGKYLKKKYPKKYIVTFVNEVAQYVHIRGDYLPDVQEWLMEKGF